MAIMLTEACINCGACEPECPNNAIYEGAMVWRWKDNTKLSGKLTSPDGQLIDSEQFNEGYSDEVYYIVPGKCTECKGFHDEPQCKEVCPVDCCVEDPDHREIDEILFERQKFLHHE